MLQHQSVNIRQISQNRAEQVGYYRFLGNKNVTVSELVRSVADQCQQQVEGLHVLSISDTSEINLQAHRGRLKPDGLGVVGNNRDVRIAKVHLQRPGNLSAQDYPPSVCLYGVEAKEVNPPAGQEPIHWRLLTTHEVVCIEQALKGIQWYCWRWRIEQLFATLKQAGLNLEATQL